MALRPIERPQNAPALTDGRQRPIGVPLRQWTFQHLDNHSRALSQLALDHVIATRTWGMTVTVDLAQGVHQKIVVSGASAFRIAQPINPTGLAKWWLIIRNASGGPLGGVVFDPSIVQQGFTPPLNGQQTSAEFLIDGNTHQQVTPWSGAATSGGGGLSGFAPTTVIAANSPFTATLDAGHIDFFKVAAGAGADTIFNLYPAVGSAAALIIKKSDAGAHNVVVTPSGGDTINGVAGAVNISAPQDTLRLIDFGAGDWETW